MLIRNEEDLKNQKHELLWSCSFVPGAFIYTISHQSGGVEMIFIVQMEKVTFRGILPVTSYNSHKDSENSYDHSHFSDEHTEP